MPGDPGGLSWAQLTDAVRAALDVPGCTGLSVAIYDPEQDPRGVGAGEIVRFLGDVATALG